MNIRIHNLLSKKDTGSSRPLSAGFHADPAREWCIGVALVIIVLIGGLLYATNLFLTEIETEYFDVTTGEVQAEVYRHAVVEKALQEYEGREASFGRLRGEAPPTPTTPPRSDEQATTTETDEVADTAPSQVE